MRVFCLAIYTKAQNGMEWKNRSKNIKKTIKNNKKYLKKLLTTGWKCVIIP